MFQLFRHPSSIARLSIAGLFLILALPGLTGTNPVWAKDWLVLKTSADKTHQLSVDTDSLKPIEPGVVAFTLKSTMTDPTKRRQRNRQKTVVLRHALRCSTQQVFPPTEITLYRGDGKQLEHVTQPWDAVKTQPRDIHELMAGDLVLRAVCPTTEPSSTATP